MNAPPIIPQSDPGAFYRAHRLEIDDAVARVLRSGRYILGDEVAAFEAEFAATFGLGHAIGVASGTDALVLALRALGIGAGDRVAAPSHTAVATVAAIELAGAEPVLIDIEPSSFTMAPTALSAAFDTIPGIKAAIAVHLYGRAADVPALRDVTRRRGAALIEDCAQAHGAALQARPIGSLGDIAAFSFYPTKNLGAFGDGGLVATANAALAERARHLRQYGWGRDPVSTLAGMNSRLDEMQAAILRTRLPYLATGNARRRAIAAAYRRGLQDKEVTLPEEDSGHVYHQFVVRHPARETLRRRLDHAGIATSIHYPVPVHLQPAYVGRVAIGPLGLVASEAAAREVVSLPIFPELDDASIARVVAAVAAAA